MCHCSKHQVTKRPNPSVSIMLTETGNQIITKMKVYLQIDLNEHYKGMSIR